MAVVTAAGAHHIALQGHGVYAGRERVCVELHLDKCTPLVILALSIVLETGIS